VSTIPNPFGVEEEIDWGLVKDVEAKILEDEEEARLQRTRRVVRPRLEITSRGSTPQGARIALDGLDISGIVTGLELKMDVGDINQAVVKLIAHEVYVDVEALAEIQAQGHKLETPANA
jgi:hypothetical protein